MTLQRSWVCYRKVFPSAVQMQPLPLLPTSSFLLLSSKALDLGSLEAQIIAVPPTLTVEMHSSLGVCLLTYTPPLIRSTLKVVVIICVLGIANI